MLRVRGPVIAPPGHSARLEPMRLGVTPALGPTVEFVAEGIMAYEVVVDARVWTVPGVKAENAGRILHFDAAILGR